MSDSEPQRRNSNGIILNESKEYESVVFDGAAAGDLAAAASPGYVTKLHALVVQAQGTVVVNLTDGNGGASLLELSFQAREGAVLPFSPSPAFWLKTSPNTALYVTVSAAETVTMTAIISRDEVK